MSDMLKERFFDFEVFPDWWCCVLGNYPEDGNITEDIKDDFIVITSDDVLARDKLMALIKDENYAHMGYNIKKYDNIILNGVVQSFTPHQLGVLNDCLINKENADIDDEHRKISSFAYQRYRNFIFQDLFDDNDGSLKAKEGCMGLDIRESDVAFTKTNLTDSEKADVISYCKHDVWSSMVFRQKVLGPYISTKLTVGRVFNISKEQCYRCTNAVLSGMVLGANKRRFADETKINISLPEELKQYITYSLPAEVVNHLCTSQSSKTFKLFDSEVTYANGGVHSVPIKMPGLKAADTMVVIAEANDEWALVNADASSFYPALMINWKSLSRTVQHPEKFAEMYHERLRFKSFIEPFEDKYGKHPENAPQQEYEEYKKYKELSLAYKLILNTTYGASGNKMLALYDPYMTTYTCRLGQLLLTSLANNIYNQIGRQNVRILQTNTDGILCYIRRNNMDMLKLICDQFTEITHILIELEEEIKIWQRNVNNYLMVKKNGKIKAKGGYFVTEMIQQGSNKVRPLDRYVCKNAIKQFLLEGKDIIEYIYTDTNLADFVITAAKGNGRSIYRTYRDGRPNKDLHTVNRVYASLDKSLGDVKIVYYRLGKRTDKTVPSCPEHAQFLNKDLRTYNFKEVRKDIDYMWYINETISLLTDQTYWYQVDGNNKLVQIEILPEEYR